jgi:hypothetical protein
MFKKTSHILIIAVLALNITGATALSFAADCGMQCCESAEWAGNGSASFKAPSCCEMEGVTCGFEAGQHQELFDEAICSQASVQKVQGERGINVPSGFFPSSPISLFPPFEQANGPPQSTPLYLSNATILC